MRQTRSALFSLLAVLLFVTCSSTRKQVSEQKDTMKDPRWVQVDSLNHQGLYASALERTKVILEDAKQANDWRTEFRAWMYRVRANGMLGNDVDSTYMELDERARTSAAPLKQLLHSVSAEGWWSRYQMDRWQILDLTNMQGEGADPATWTQATFINKVIDEFNASLVPAEELQGIPIGDLADLLTNADSGAALRPTLYDVLAHRALDVFKNSETRITEPAWRFTLNEPVYFELFEPFALRKLQHRDSTAWEFKALEVYQRLERMHLVDNAPSALVDLTLERLRYVRDNSTLSEKDSLYLHALGTLQSRLVKDTAWAEVTVAIAEEHAERGNAYQRLADGPNKWEKRTAQALCDSAIAKFPGSFGAKNALVLKTNLERTALDLQVEQAISPNTVSTIALGYTNTNKVWFRVVLDQIDVNVALEPRQDRAKVLLTQPALLEWSVDLKNDGDLQRHMIELPVAGLPFGHYAIIASAGSEFVSEKDAIVHASFWVTELAISERKNGNDQELLVLDRETGAPRSGVNVEGWFQENNYQQGRKFRKVAELTTNAEGNATFPVLTDRGMLTWVLSDGDDRFQTGSRWYYSYTEQPEREQLSTYLFTDRAIYRPGQEIFFKGIVISQKGKTNKVVTGHKEKVVLYDVNGEQVDTLNVITDAFGAYHGKFKAPLGVLTGSMRIDAGSGSHSVQVEEYKRPTFEVIFDPITSAAKLDQEALVTGIAKSYAGVPLDGATVQWTVERNTRMPWYCGWFWRGLPWGQSTEIASGETLCDADGKFNISFKAIADHAFPSGADPLFAFTVEASATDINGETQTSTTTLNLGYRSIEIDIDLNGSIDRNVTDSLGVHIRNLNGEEQDVPMHIRIVELVPPADAPQRERLWERPDRAYEGELATMHLPDDPMSWPVQREHLVLQGHRAMGKELFLKGVEDWTVGMYRIEVSAMDADGKEVKVSKLFTVYDTEIQNTGFVNEAFHVQPVKTTCEPGEKAVFLISSALPEGRILMEVEREGEVVVTRWFLLHKGEQRVELPVLAGDRGGFAVHFLSVERGRVHTTTEQVDVPWTIKQLKVEWLSFRDKLLPGSKEEWRLKITGRAKEKVAAQVLAVMYDTSLDHFVKQRWDMFQWPMNGSRLQRYQNEPFGAERAQEVYRTVPIPNTVFHVYPELELYGAFQQRYYRHRFSGGRAEEDGMLRAMPMMAKAEVSAGLVADEAEPTPPPAPPEDGPQAGSAPQPVRTDFRETAFFFPDLLTDKDGSVVLRFTTPDALTRWNVLGIAHTKALRLVQFEKQATTSKPLMVVPNLPRFFREGDRMDLTAKINVLESNNLQGNATIAFFDPTTNEDLTSKFGVVGTAQRFTAGKGKSANVAWSITVPAGVSIASVRITATAAGIGDGEERPIPVLTDKVLITESLPIAISKAGTHTFTLDKLVNSAKPGKNGQGSTVQNKLLKLEYTPNPAWYAVQALPYLMEFPHACAEQVFSRYYANRLAGHIVEERPAIKKVFEAWSASPSPREKGSGSGSPSPWEKGVGDEGAFLSALEKNAELKNVLLEETPWVVNAQDEGERKRRIALFFDLQRMSTEEAVALRKLGEMQLPNGAFPWWTGMRPSRYITQHIVAGFGHLEVLKASDLRTEGPVQQLLKKAVEWLDAEVEKEYAELVKRSSKETLANYTPSGTDIHYLYARSFFPRWPINGATNTAVEFYTERAKATWLLHSMQEQAMLALAFERMKEGAAAQTIMRSLGERATRSEELGMYWKGEVNGVDWWNFPTETHALMIEAFHQVAKDASSVDALRQYLLKLKQTTDWKTTKATAEACYALLLTGDDLLGSQNEPVITVGNKRINTDAQEAGTGYFTKTWSDTEITPAMGELTVTTKADGVQWGALHWQYLEQMDKVTPHESPFSLEKKVMLHEQSDAGAQLIELKDARPLKAGDKLTIRIVMRTDRYVDYVHLKDLRAAGLEPVEAISGYRWQGGLGYYQSIKDVAMHFFFDRIAPGTYTFEYDLRVTHAGDFSNGVTTAMCMYAPEFSSHSEGLRVKVGE